MDYIIDHTHCNGYTVTSQDRCKTNIVVLEEGLHFVIPASKLKSLTSCTPALSQKHREEREGLGLRLKKVSCEHNSHIPHRIIVIS